jgi:hypothetical protein
MAATRVRVLFEYRNGDGNYLAIRPRGGKWIPCKDDMDEGALKAAFISAVQDHGCKAPEFKEQPKPSHD